jgi:hypothetical protein
MYKFILSRPFDCNISTISSISNVSLNKNQVITIIKDINIPVINPQTIPSLVGEFFEIGFFSTFRYHIVGTKKIQTLQDAKNNWDNNSFSIISIPNITDTEGIKPTNNMAMRGLLCNSIICPKIFDVMNIRPTIEFNTH